MLGLGGRSDGAGVRSDFEGLVLAVRDFDAFYVESYGRLAAYGSSLTGDYAAGDDLAQEALTRVYVRWRRLRDPTPYAYRVVTNLSRDLARTRVREQAVWSAISHQPPTPALDRSTLDAVLRLSGVLRETVLLHYGRVPGSGVTPRVFLCE